MESEPLDTRVTNGRFVGPGAPANAQLTIHDGVIVDASDHDVWRTVNASGHLVFPGLIQPASVIENEGLAKVRGGVTTAIPVPGSSTTNATLDYLDGSSLSIKVIEPDESGQLSCDDWNLLLSEEPVHFQSPPNSAFPIIHFLFHEGHINRSMTIERIVALTSGNIARHCGIFPQKGSFTTGSDGDLFVFDPHADDLYSDIAWPGRVIFSMLRGQILLFNGQIHTSPGDGRPVAIP